MLVTPRLPPPSPLSLPPLSPSLPSLPPSPPHCPNMATLAALVDAPNASGREKETRDFTVAVAAPAPGHRSTCDFQKAGAAVLPHPNWPSGGAGGKGKRQRRQRSRGVAVIAASIHALHHVPSQALNAGRFLSLTRQLSIGFENDQLQKCSLKNGLSNAYYIIEI